MGVATGKPQRGSHSTRPPRPGGRVCGQSRVYGLSADRGCTSVCNRRTGGVCRGLMAGIGLMIVLPRIGSGALTPAVAVIEIRM